MRQRDERFNGQDKQPTGQAKPIRRFSPQDFRFNDDNTCICPAGQTLHSPGSIYTTRTGLRYQVFMAQASDCTSCALRSHCLKSQGIQRGRQVTRFESRVRNPLETPASA